MKLAALLLFSAAALLPQTALRISQPTVVRMVAPEYTAEALAAKTEGLVTLEAVVGTDGSISKVKVVKLLGKGLDDKAVECVQKWRFKPAMRDGEAIAVKTTIEVNFRLDSLQGPPVLIRFRKILVKLASHSN
jgi:TonB family protein